MNKFIVLLVGILLFGCTIDLTQVDIEQVRFVTPDTYFPPEIHVKHYNKGSKPIQSIKHTVEYRSPIVDTTYWSREIICSYSGDGLQPGEALFSRCDWKDGNVPPTRTDREPNASLFLTDVSISTK